MNEEITMKKIESFADRIDENETRFKNQPGRPTRNEILGFYRASL